MPTRDDLAQMFAGQKNGYGGNEKKYLAQRRMRGLSDAVFGLPDLLNTGINAGIRDVGSWAGMNPDDVYQLPMASQAAANLATEATGASIVPEGDVPPATRQSGANQQALMGMLPTGGEDIAPAVKSAMFIGAGAKNAPSLFLKAAEEDLAKGVLPKEVWQHWGWGRGADDKMRAEISDRGAGPNLDEAEWRRDGAGSALRTKEEKRLPMTDKWGAKSKNDQGEFWAERSMPLQKPETFGNMFKHDNLFEAYPQLRDIDYNAGTTSQGQAHGVYYRPGEDGDKTGTIEAHGPKPYADDFKQNPRDVTGISLHEGQHAIQNEEGFARGGNMQERGMGDRGTGLRWQAEDELYDIREGKGGPVDPAYVKKLEEIRDEKDPAFLGYRSLAGEVEARNVQTRRQMTGRERNETPFWETEDIPRHYQTVKQQSDPIVGEDDAEGNITAMRDQLTGLAAPAVHTGGNQSTINKIYEHAAEQRTPSYPEAKEPVFKYASDGGLAETKELVPQVSIRGTLPPKPEEGNFPAKGRAVPIHENRDALAAMIAGDLAPYINDPSYKPQQFYSTGPVIRGLSDIGGLSPEEGGDFMHRWSGQGAATSPRTKTPSNLRNASYLLHRQAIGDPLTPEKHAAEGNRPGFPMMGMHTDLADKFAKGTNDPWNNPKPSTFRENWAGNLQDVTGDTHYIRATLDALDRLHPGTLPRQWFNSDEGFQRYVKAGGFPKGGELPVGDIDDKLKGAMIPGQRKAQTEYGVMTEPGYLAAQKLNITPAEAQAAMWFVNGPRTGLRSPAMTIPDLLNAQIEATAKATGLAPEKILKLWSTGAIPLASNETAGQQGTSGLA